MDRIVGTLPPGDWVHSWVEEYEDGTTTVLTEPIIGWVVYETGECHAMARDGVGGLTMDLGDNDDVHLKDVAPRGHKKMATHLPSKDHRRRDGSSASDFFGPLHHPEGL
jgi:hypothetical protein